MADRAATQEGQAGAKAKEGGEIDIMYTDTDITAKTVIEIGG